MFLVVAAFLMSWDAVTFLSDSSSCTLSAIAFRKPQEPQSENPWFFNFFDFRSLAHADNSLQTTLIGLFAF